MTNKVMRTLRGFLIVGVIAVTTTIGVFAEFGDTVLKKGMEHEDIQPIKYMLAELDYLESKDSNLTTSFDDALFNGVKGFQEDYALKADGVIGGDTVRYILSVYNSQELILEDLNGTLLKKGMNHEQVSVLKKVFIYLGLLGEDVSINNSYDDELFAAVKKFQKEYDIKDDGIIGDDTTKIIQAVVKQQEIVRNGGTASKVNVNELLSRGTAAPRSGNTIIETGKKLLGVRYSWGGTSPKGVDCSGFTSWTFKQLGVKLPRTASSQIGVGTAVSRGELKAGDLVFFGTSRARIGHVGIYMGNNQFIHASTSKRKVVIENFSNYCSNSHYVGGRRVNI